MAADKRQIVGLALGMAESRRSLVGGVDGSDGRDMPDRRMGSWTLNPQIISVQITSYALNAYP